MCRNMIVNLIGRFSKTILLLINDIMLFEKNQTKSKFLFFTKNKMYYNKSNIFILKK